MGRRTYPDWLTSPSEAGPSARLRCVAFTLVYRSCLLHVLGLSDVLGRALEPPRPMAASLSHEVCQRWVRKLERHIHSARL